MEAVIAEWGQENYPRLMSNPKAIENLYMKHIMKKPSRSQNVAYPLVSIHEIKVGSPVTLLVTKVDSEVKRMTLCKQCGKAKCLEAGHPPERTPFFIVSMDGADGTGSGKFKKLGSDEAVVRVIEENKEFIVTGTSKHDPRWGDEIEMKAVVPLTKEQLTAWDALQDYAQVHGGEAGISETEFEFFTKGKETLLAPFFEHVFIDRQNGRVKW